MIARAISLIRPIAVQAIVITIEMVSSVKTWETKCTNPLVRVNGAPAQGPTCRRAQPGLKKTKAAIALLPATLDTGYNTFGFGGSGFESGTDPTFSLESSPGNGSVTITAVAVPEPTGMFVLLADVAAATVRRRRKNPDGFHPVRLSASF